MNRKSSTGQEQGSSDLYKKYIFWGAFIGVPIFSAVLILTESHTELGLISTSVGWSIITGIQLLLWSYLIKEFFYLDAGFYRKAIIAIITLVSAFSIISSASIALAGNVVVEEYYFIALNLLLYVVGIGSWYFTFMKQGLLKSLLDIILGK